MRRAFVLINVEIGAEGRVVDALKAIPEVLEALRAVPEVREAHTVYGTYDIIARVEAGTSEELKLISTWKIRGLDKVRSTTTLICAEGVEND